MACAYIRWGSGRLERQLAAGFWGGDEAEADATWHRGYEAVPASLCIREPECGSSPARRALGPLVFGVPPGEQGRYYLLPFYDAFTNVIASLGTRTGRTSCGAYLLAGPGHHEPSSDGTEMIRSPSQRGSMLGRYLVSGAQDLPRVAALQDQMSLTDLADWQAGHRAPWHDAAHPDPVPGASVPDVRGDPTAFWQVAGELMRGTPIPQADRDHFARFAELGLTADGFTKPGDPDTRDSLYQGTREGWELILPT